MPGSILDPQYLLFQLILINIVIHLQLRELKVLISYDRTASKEYKQYVKPIHNECHID